MSKKVEYNKDDLVELAGKKYIVIVSGRSQITLKPTEDGGTQRRVTKTSPAYANIKLITASETKTETDESSKAEKKAPKKRLGKKSEVKEEVQSVDFGNFEKDSFQILEDIERDNAETFLFPEPLKISSWWYSIQRATKAQRIGYIQWKLEQEGPNSLFGLMLALYKTRIEVKVNYEDFQDRVLIDEFGKGKRPEQLKIADVLKALKPLINVSRNKVKQEVMDNFIMTIPDDKNQGWAFHFLNQTASEWGSLKLSVQDLENIKIPMA